MIKKGNKYDLNVKNSVISSVDSATLLAVEIDKFPGILKETLVLNGLKNYGSAKKLKKLKLK